MPERDCKYMSQLLRNAEEMSYFIASDAASNHRSADAASSAESHFVWHINVRNVFVLTKNGQMHH
jgi:hypothetical protein